MTVFLFYYYECAVPLPSYLHGFWWKKSDLNLIEDSLHVISCFSPADLKILSLVCNSLLCLDVNAFEFILLGVCCAFWCVRSSFKQLNLESFQSLLKFFLPFLSFFLQGFSFVSWYTSWCSIGLLGFAYFSFCPLRYIISTDL